MIGESMCLIFMDSRFRGNDRKRLYGEFLEVPLCSRFSGKLDMYLFTYVPFVVKAQVKEMIDEVLQIIAR